MGETGDLCGDTDLDGCRRCCVLLKLDSRVSVAKEGGYPSYHFLVNSALAEVVEGSLAGNVVVRSCYVEQQEGGHLALCPRLVYPLEEKVHRVVCRCQNSSPPICRLGRW